MTNGERIQREFSLVATIRRKLPAFVKACADDTELVLPTRNNAISTDEAHGMGCLRISPHPSGASMFSSAVVFVSFA
jgi:hypothetical protein